MTNAHSITAATTSGNFNWARGAGIAYLLVAILAAFAEFSVRQTMTVDGDTAATLANIAAQPGVYGLAGVADLFVLLLDVFLAIAFWVLLKPVNRHMALAALILNLLRLPLMGANVIFHFGALFVADGALSSFSPEQVNEMGQLFLDLHHVGYTANGILFGAWCFVVGWLFVRSGFMPKLLGYGMMVALAGYWSDMLVVFLAPEHADAVSPIAVMPAAIGEIAVALWLTIMGGRVFRRYLTRTRPTVGPGLPKASAVPA